MEPTGLLAGPHSHKQPMVLVGRYYIWSHFKLKYRTVEYSSILCVYPSSAAVPFQSKEFVLGRQYISTLLPFFLPVYSTHIYTVANVVVAFVEEVGGSRECPILEGRKEGRWKSVQYEAAME